MSGKPTDHKGLGWTTRDGKPISARPLKVDELDAVYALSHDQLKAEMADRAVAEGILRHNSDAIWGVYEMEGEHEKGLVGFLSFLMLTAEGAAAVRTGKFDALHPDLRYQVRSGERPSLVYIWLIVARGFGGLAIPLVTHAMGSLYVGIPMCGKAATEAGAQAFRNFGFQPVHRGKPDVGSVFWRDTSPSAIKVETNSPSIRVAVAHSSLEFEHARAIRAVVYMGEQLCPYAEEFDGNDYTATHFVAYVDDEPAATLRVRYFGSFVKIERLAVLKRFRGKSLADEITTFALEFLARKGFTKGYGHPQLHALEFWKRHGFRLIEEVPQFAFSDHQYVAVEGDITPHDDAITIHTDPMRVVRPEGDWDVMGVLDQSAARPATNPRA